MNPFLQFILSLGGYGFDYLQNQNQNTLATQREADTLARVGDAQAGVTNALVDLPAVTYGGTTYRPPGQFGGANPGGPGGGTPVNLDDLFRSGEQSLDFFKSNKPNTVVSPFNMDFSGLQGKLEGIAGGASLKPGTLAGAVDFPNTDLSSVLAADIAGIGSASKARQEGRQASLAGSAGAFGGLEGVQRESSSLGFQEGANRAGLASTSTAQNRAQEADLEKFKADLQSKLGLGEAEINSALAQSLMSGTLGAGQLNFQTESIKKAIEEGNINRAIDLFRQQLGLVGLSGQEDTQRGMTALDTLLKQAGSSAGAASQDLSSSLVLSQILGSTPGQNQDVLSLLNAMGAWTQPRDTQPKQRGQYGVNVLGTGANWAA